MRPITTDLSFFKKFKLIKKPTGSGGPVALLASDEEEDSTTTPSVVDKAVQNVQKVLADDEVLQVIIKNPGMNASTFYNTLKSKGMRIVKEANRIRESKRGPFETKYPTRKKTWKEKCHETFKPKKISEADAASANAGALRTKESVIHNFPILSRFMEGAAVDSGVGHTKFRVILLQEGLGNFKDGYYYTRGALESAVPVFEGKKIYADHPSAQEEQIRPERSVKDVLGHFEHLTIQEGADGQAQLVADVVILPEEPYRWARALMSHSVAYAKKYPDKDFIGLSINASGDADAKALKDFIAMGGVPDAAMLKLQKAQADGIEVVKVVSSIKNAISCDLVTEAGAGGKILEMLEKGEYKMSKKNVKLTEKEAQEKKEKDVKEAAEKSTKESGMEGKEAKQGDDKAPAKKGGDEKVGDQAADEELIKKMIAEYLGSDEADSEEVMKMCKEAYEAYTEMGYESTEAIKAAGHSMKLAKHMAGKESAMEGDDEKEPKDGEKKKDDKETKESASESMESTEKKTKESSETKEAATESKEAKKESMEKNKESASKASGDVDLKEANLALVAEVTALKDKMKAIDLDKHIEKTLKESGLPRSATTLFREKAGTMKNAGDFDSKFKLFCETYKSVRGSETDGFDFVISSEKREDKKGTTTFEDCVS